MMVRQTAISGVETQPRTAPLDGIVRDEETNGRVVSRLGGWFLGAVLVGLGAVLFAISQSPFEYGDEGFHLIASHLINAGKRPYLDFFYQHTPLYLYTNAIWMRLAGTSWRSAHALSAILTAGTAAMIAGYVYSRMKHRPLSFVWAAVAAIFFGSTAIITEHGLLGQPHALAVTLVFAAFLLTLRAQHRPRFSSFWPGLASGAAIGVSLLTAPVPPLLLAWLLVYAERGKRWRTCLLFLIGAAVALLPLGWLALQGPEQTWFNVVWYQLTGRHRGTFQREAGLRWLIKACLTSAQGIILILLSLAGIGFALISRPNQPQRLRQELRLCGLMALCLTVYLCLPKPTFAQYFLTVVPFLSVLAMVGLLGISSSFRPGASLSLVAVVLTIFLLGGARSVARHIRHPLMTWTELDQIGTLLNDVTPANCPIYAPDGAVYFAARRIPPPGLENNYAFTIDLGSDLNRLFHITPQQQINQAVANGTFGTVVAWSPKEAEDLELSSRYAEHRGFPTHSVYWQWADPSYQPCNESSGPNMAGSGDN